MRKAAAIITAFALAAGLAGCTDEWSYEATGRAVVQDGTPYPIYALKGKVVNAHGGLDKVATAEVVRAGDRFLPCEPDCARALLRHLQSL